MVTLKASYTVKPAAKTPSGLMYLSDFDQFTAISHTPTVYFYRPAGNHLFTVQNPIEILKDSLSKALVIFHPLAGRLQHTARGRFELNLNSAGALLLEAVSEAKIDDFRDFCPTPEMKALMPSVDYGRPIQELPLLLVQLTKFSCGGLSVSVGISHVLVDGKAAAHFVSEWARFARGHGQPENLPFLDRTILRAENPSPQPSFDHLEFIPAPLLIGQSSSMVEQKKETAVAMLKLTKEQIDKLKNKANEHRPNKNGPFTRYEAVAAHVWRCTCMARQHENQQLTRVRVAVDFRKRMQPPLPDWYFGSAVLLVVPTATSGEIVSKPLGYTSGKLREAIEMVTDEYVRSSLVFLENEPDLSKFRFFHPVGSTRGAFHGNPNMGITNWTRLGLHGADFGWGKEIYMGPGGLGYDGQVFILPGDDENGSFVIPLRLQVGHMHAFKKFFYEDI